MKTFEFEGKVYEAVPAIESGSCKGCSHRTGDNGCLNMPGNCTTPEYDIIWNEFIKIFIGQYTITRIDDHTI